MLVSYIHTGYVSDVSILAQNHNLCFYLAISDADPSLAVRERAESHLECTFLLWYPRTHLQPAYVSTSWSQTVHFDPKHYTWAGAPALKRGSGFTSFQQVKTNLISYQLFLFGRGGEGGDQNKFCVLFFHIGCKTSKSWKKKSGWKIIKKKKSFLMKTLPVLNVLCSLRRAQQIWCLVTCNILDSVQKEIKHQDGN